MNKWIDDKSNLVPSTSKRPMLKAQSPVTKSVPKSRPASNQKRARLPIAPVQALPPSIPPIAKTRKTHGAQNQLGVLKSAQQDPFEIKSIPRVSGGDMPVTLEPDDDSDDKRWFTDFAFFYGIPSWMVSFIFHLALIISLALFSFATRDGRHIEFVMADESMPNALEMMDVAVDLSPLEDVQEDLIQESETDQLVDDFDELESELESDFSHNPLAEQMDAIEALDVSNLDFKRGDGKGASFFGTGAAGNRFVFVVDCSGSMADEYRWIMARRELKDAILGLTEQQQFFVFLYNDSSFSYSRRKPKLMNATQNNKEKIFKWLDRQSPIGDTRPWRAMKSSLGLKPNAVFLLSDGELKDDTVIRLRQENVERTKKGEKIGKIPIHTISLGTGFGAETMRAISSQNDGTFTRVNTW